VARERLEPLADARAGVAGAVLLAAGELGQIVKIVEQAYASATGA
jgi:hypothetical protein